MASIRAYIRTQNKNKEAKVRFLLIDKKTNLSYVSNLTVNPLYWDTAKQGYNNSKQITPIQRSELQRSIDEIKNLMLSAYLNQNTNSDLTSVQLSEIINDKLQNPVSKVKPEKTVTRTTNPKKSKPVSEKKEVTLIDAFNFTMEHNDISYKRKQTYMVVRYSLEKFIYYKIHFNSRFILTLENTDVNTLWELERFFTNEPDLIHINKKIKQVFPRYSKPDTRARNTVINFMRILRAVFNFAIRHDMTQNYPFKKYKMKEEVYSTPFYPTLDELKHLYQYRFESQTLNQQRDIFIFQCQVGMRINDLYNLKRSNIHDNTLEYIPTKTKQFRVKTITVPLNSTAMEILNRYTENELILPFISQQKYNDYLKKIFTIAEITRPVTLIDPKTNTETVKPLNEIIHSHAARKYFCAKLFEEVRDQSIVAELSAHSPNSVVFQRYRNISHELKKSLTDNLF